MVEMISSYILTLAINIGINATYAILVLRNWRRQPPEIRKLQTLNTLCIIIALGFTQYFLAGYFYNLSQNRSSANFYSNVLSIVFIAITVLPGGIALVYRVIKPKTPENVEEIRAIISSQANSPHSVVQHDLLRKGTHVIIFIAIFAIDMIGFYILVTIFKDPYPLRFLRLEEWGYGLNNYIIFAWSWGDWIGMNLVVPAARIIVFGVLYCLTLLFLTSELCRLSHHWHYLFEKAVLRTLRTRELDRMGAYALFAAGFLLASLFLPYFGIMGMLAGWSLGDLAAAQVGMRWGRHHILNQDKTWEGLLAGALLTFVASLPFLGLVWAGTLTAAFVGIDLLTEKPIPMSDNLLLPVVGAVLFTILMAAGISVESIFIALA